MLALSDVIHLLLARVRVEHFYTLRRHQLRYWYCHSTFSALKAKPSALASMQLKRDLAAN